MTRGVLEYREGGGNFRVEEAATHGAAARGVRSYLGRRGRQIRKLIFLSTESDANLQAVPFPLAHTQGMDTGFNILRIADSARIFRSKNVHFDGNLSADLPWRTSSYCNNSSCVEVAMTPDFVAVRDSKNPEHQSLVYTNDEWRQFIAGAKNGEFDVS